MHATLRSTVRVLPLAAVVALLLAPAGAGAASIPSPGRYRGTTGDGHVFQFTVEPSAKSGFARKITHFYLVYDIANCRSGPVRQPFFTSVRTTGPVSGRGRFSRFVGQRGRPNEVQVRLTGRFTSTTRATGSFRVGVVGRCPLDPNGPALSFTARRR
jgi:hypothetical protein